MMVVTGDDDHHNQFAFFQSSELSLNSVKSWATTAAAIEER